MIFTQIHYYNMQKIILCMQIMLLSTTTHDFTVSIFHDLLVYEISLNTFLMDLLHKKGTHTYFQILEQFLTQKQTIRRSEGATSDLLDSLMYIYKHNFWMWRCYRSTISGLTVSYVTYYCIFLCFHASWCFNIYMKDFWMMQLEDSMIQLIIRPTYQRIVRLN